MCLCAVLPPLTQVEAEAGTDAVNGGHGHARALSFGLGPDGPDEEAAAALRESNATLLSYFTTMSSAWGDEGYVAMRRELLNLTSGGGGGDADGDDGDAVLGGICGTATDDLF